MCDTIIAPGNATGDGSVIFGKNSDREPNEAHEIVIVPRMKHKAGETVQCTYVAISQAAETFQVLLAKPFWIWGAEMGSNEFGVTIGNEAVFTRIPYDKKPGLIGMDFLRLGLERGKTAAEALEVITSLLEEHGQGGDCGFARHLYYHNSFLICDFEEAWVLETAGREWAAEKIKTVRTISNAITIGPTWDRASKNLVSTAVKKGWCRSEADFHFARCYSEPIYTKFSDARRRQACTTRGLLESAGRVTVQTMIDILSSHKGDDDPGWSPGRGITGADVCMHAGWGPIRGSQTTGSMITVLKKGEPPVHWVTGTAAPCTSLFKPVWIDAGIPESGPAPEGTCDESTLYWRHESLHREIIRNYPARIKLIADERRLLQSEFLDRAGSHMRSSAQERGKISGEAAKRSDEAESRWRARVRGNASVTRNSFLYNRAWRRFNKEAGIAIKI